MAIKKLRERLVYENRWIRLYDDVVVFPDGKSGTYVRLTLQGSGSGVVVVPSLPDGRKLLLKVHRYPVQSLSLEFPRGIVAHGEDSRDAVARELAEETGIRATDFQLIGTQWPDTGLLSTVVEIYLARLPLDFEKTMVLNMAEGIVDFIIVSDADIRSLIFQGDIKDGFTLGALMYLNVQRPNH